MFVLGIPGLKDGGKVIEVEHFDVLDFGNFGQIVIVGQDAGFGSSGQVNQFGVYPGDVREVNVFDDYFNFRVAAQSVEHFKPPPAPLSFKVIRRVGNRLQFLNDKTGNDQAVIHESGMGQVQQPAVNNYVAVQK